MARKKKDRSPSDLVRCVSSFQLGARIYIDSNVYLADDPGVKEAPQYFCAFLATTAEQSEQRVKATAKPEPQPEPEPAPKPKKMVRAKRSVRLSGVPGPLGSLKPGETRLNEGDELPADAAIVAANKGAFEPA